ncbi:MAG TPA: hypothetical protein VMW26_00985 [Methanomassiliicoccales archaeon]|nr:hypothetical protein [Methanomassiliicoccales archaeon]
MDLEEELRPSINQWMLQEGLHPINEYRICWRIPDVVGVRDGRIEVAVEMKLSDWKGALRQASIYTIFSVKSFVAMPSKKQALVLRHIREFRRRGVGILMVRGDGSVSELIASGQHQAAFSYATP